MRIGLAIALVAAAAAAELLAEQPCPACTSPENSGLCHMEACRRQVLPQLKEPSWHRDAHSGKYFETGKDKPSAVASACEVPRPRSRGKNRVRERSKRNTALRRLSTQLAGGFAPTRHARANASTTA